MSSTCNYPFDMATMIQIRHVPDALHRRLKSRAALEGLSLSEFLLREIERVAARPTLAELQARLEKRQPIVSGESAAKAVRAERTAR
jgi:hypothetical protein